jgi:hypothetical protein
MIICSYSGWPGVHFHPDGQTCMRIQTPKMKTKPTAISTARNARELLPAIM